MYCSTVHIVAILRFSVTVFLMPGTNDATARSTVSCSGPRGDAEREAEIQYGPKSTLRTCQPPPLPPFAKKNPFILFPRVAALAFMMKVGGQKSRPFTRRLCPIRRRGLQWPQASLTIHYRTEPPDTERERERERKGGDEGGKASISNAAGKNGKEHLHTMCMAHPWKSVLYLDVRTYCMSISGALKQTVVWFREGFPKRVA